MSTEQLSAMWSWGMAQQGPSVPSIINIVTRNEGSCTALGAQSSLEPDLRKKEGRQAQDPGGSQV